MSVRAPGAAGLDCGDGAAPEIYLQVRGPRFPLHWWARTSGSPLQALGDVGIRSAVVFAPAASLS